MCWRRCLGILLPFVMLWKYSGKKVPKFWKCTELYIIMMEEVCSSEMWTYFCNITQSHISKNSDLYWVFWQGCLEAVLFTGCTAQMWEITACCWLRTRMGRIDISVMYMSNIKRSASSVAVRDVRLWTELIRIFGHEMEKVEKGYSEFISAKYFYD